ncbi:hypothetical protein HAX54_042019 [Datura stramonium]|uniref:Protease Do-like PDZ domain-containing protein n=1 Tax=Datura stramonium TaxID=4076 RepID=A0ABS8SMW6_DATST|nr:hypothetical protein [Datura stramonium]
MGDLKRKRGRKPKNAVADSSDGAGTLQRRQRGEAIGSLTNGDVTTVLSGDLRHGAELVAAAAQQRRSCSRIGGESVLRIQSQISLPGRGRDNIAPAVVGSSLVEGGFLRMLHPWSTIPVLGKETILEFGDLPALQDAVTVVGYPIGGDTISVTSGVVSRIEILSYVHVSTSSLWIAGYGLKFLPFCNTLSNISYWSFYFRYLLAMIDAAINSGNSGGPAFSDKGKCVDYEKNGAYTGFPIIGIEGKMENPDLRFVANDGTVPFRHGERIGFSYLVSQKYTGDDARKESSPMEKIMNLMSAKLLDKLLHAMAQSIDEQLVVVSQVLVADINIGYEELVNTQVIAFNGKPVKNLKSLANMVEACDVLFLDCCNWWTKNAKAATSDILAVMHCIPSAMSDDLKTENGKTEKDAVEICTRFAVFIPDTSGECSSDIISGDLIKQGNMLYTLQPFVSCLYNLSLRKTCSLAL